MKKLLVCLAAILSLPAVADNAEAIAEEEIAHLIGYLESSDCQFYRNGSWYDSARAVSHLNRKYRYLERRDLVPDTEAFIKRAATESSRSGKPYLVKCPGDAEVPSAAWFSEELAQFRAEREAEQGGAGKG